MRGGPSWIYDLPASERRLCAIGVSGPTLDSGDAGGNAESAARIEIAQALALHVRGATAILDDDVLFGAATHACDGCADAAAAAQVVDRWSDERGAGPIPFPGTTYAFLCMER